MHGAISVQRVCGEADDGYGDEEGEEGKSEEGVVHVLGETGSCCL